MYRRARVLGDVEAAEKGPTACGKRVTLSRWPGVGEIAAIWRR